MILMYINLHHVITVDSTDDNTNFIYRRASLSDYSWFLFTFACMNGWTL